MMVKRIPFADNATLLLGERLSQHHTCLQHRKCVNQVGPISTYLEGLVKKLYKRENVIIAVLHKFSNKLVYGY